MSAYSSSIVNAVCTLIFISASALVAADIPSEWEVKYELLPIYTIQKAADHNETFFVGSMPKSPNPEKQFASYVSSPNKEATVEDISWKSFSGKMFTRKMRELISISIVVTDGTRVWTGGYFGSERDWPEVLKVLKTLDLK